MSSSFEHCQANHQGNNSAVLREDPGVCSAEVQPETVCWNEEQQVDVFSEEVQVTKSETVNSDFCCVISFRSISTSYRSSFSSSEQTDQGASLGFFTYVSRESEVDMSETEYLQCKYDKLMSAVEENCEKEHIPAGKIASLISNQEKISKEFKEDLKEKCEIRGVFSVFRVYATWFDTGMLKRVATLLDTDIQEEITEFEDKLRTYLKKRLKVFRLAARKEAFLLCIDDAWDREALQGEDCTRSCKQIAAILGKSGQVKGSLLGQLLCINILE